MRRIRLSLFLLALGALAIGESARADMIWFQGPGVVPELDIVSAFDVFTSLTDNSGAGRFGIDSGLILSGQTISVGAELTFANLIPAFSVFHLLDGDGATGPEFSLSMSYTFFAANDELLGSLSLDSRREITAFSTMTEILAPPPDNPVFVPRDPSCGFGRRSRCPSPVTTDSGSTGTGEGEIDSGGNGNNADIAYQLGFASLDNPISRVLIEGTAVMPENTSVGFNLYSLTGRTYGFFDTGPFPRVDDEPPVPVSEPGILGLLGVGLAGFGLARRRRKA